MTDQVQENTNINNLSDILPQLTHNQLRYVSVRNEYSSDKEAAEALGLSPQTVWHWPDHVNEAVKLMAKDGIHVAREVLRRNTSKAAAVKVAGLDSDDEKIRQDAASEILDRQLGKPTQSQDHKFSGSFEVNVNTPWRNATST
jgi:hypothetical protein